MCVFPVRIHIVSFKRNALLYSMLPGFMEILGLHPLLELFLNNTAVLINLHIL